jgi:hypothetical protein
VQIPTNIRRSSIRCRSNILRRKRVRPAIPTSLRIRDNPRNKVIPASLRTQTKQGSRDNQGSPKIHRKPDNRKIRDNFRIPDNLDFRVSPAKSCNIPDSRDNLRIQRNSNRSIQDNRSIRDRFNIPRNRLILVSPLRTQFSPADIRQRRRQELPVSLTPIRRIPASPTPIRRIPANLPIPANRAIPANLAILARAVAALFRRASQALLAVRLHHQLEIRRLT